MGDIVKKATDVTSDIATGDVGGLGETFGLVAPSGTGSAAMARSIAMQREIFKRLDELDIPDIEKQKIALAVPELVLSSQEERLDESELENIIEDPTLRQSVKDAMAEFGRQAEEGLTAEDRARYEALRQTAAADEQARQASLLENMAQRGALDSGAQLAAQLGSSQAQAQRQNQAALQMAADASRARREALAQRANLASNLRTQDFGQATQKARASDLIKQFNASVASRDTAAKRQYEQQKANIANQQQTYNKGLQQQEFENRLRKATGAAGAGQNLAAAYANQAAAQTQAAQQKAAGTRGLILGGARAAFGKGAKDGGIKYEDGGIAPISYDPYYNEMLTQEHESLKNKNRSNRLLNALEEFQQGFENGSEMIPVRKQKNINPVDFSRMKLNDGGYKKMGYEEGGMQTDGRIVPGESYEGDMLEDRINSGEMVLNLNQQNRLNNLLKELATLRKARLDSSVAEGDLEINEDQQEDLMNVIKGNKEPEQLNKEDIVRPSGMNDLIKLLGME